MAIMGGRASIGLAAAALLAAVPATAQIEPGDRVRVHAAGQRSIIGTLRSLDETARRSRKARGGLIGFLGGAAAGMAVGHGIAGSCSERDFLCLYPREARGTYMAVSAVAFGLIGGVIGAAVAPGEKWGRVPVDRIRVGVLTGPARGVGLGVSVGF
jgi:hypothetical protein